VLNSEPSGSQPGGDVGAESVSHEIARSNLSTFLTPSSIAAELRPDLDPVEAADIYTGACIDDDTQAVKKPGFDRNWGFTASGAVPKQCPDADSVEAADMYTAACITTSLHNQDCAPPSFHRLDRHGAPGSQQSLMVLLAACATPPAALP